MLGRQKNKPVRLAKKISLSERVQCWIDRNSFYLIIFAGVIIVILSTVLLFTFVQSGTESGLWYNYFGGV